MANVPLGQAARATRTVSAGIGPISWGYIDIGFLLCMLTCLVLPWHCTIPVFLSFVNRVFSVKGRAWRHRLLRAPGMSNVAATPPSLKLPGMLDEPLGSLPLSREQQLRQPVVPSRGGKEKH